MIADVFATDQAVKSYVVSGQDAEKASVQYIIDGKQSMTVFKDVRTLVKDAMGMAVALLDGKTPELAEDATIRLTAKLAADTTQGSNP